MPKNLDSQMRFDFFGGESIGDLYNDDLRNGTEGSAFLLPYPSSAKWSSFPNRVRFPIQDGATEESKVPYEVVHQQEPWRHLAVLGKGTSAILTASPPEILVNYWREYFELAYENVVVLPEKAYVEEINRGRDKVITLFPYDAIEDSKHAVRPDVHFDLHGKFSLEKMGVPLPEQNVVQVEKLDELRGSFPFVIKSSHGLSGDGTWIVNCDRDFDRAVLAVKQYGLKVVLVQKCVDAKNNFGLQYYLSKNGKVRIIGLSKQITDNEGHYQGGYVDFRDQNLDRFGEIIQNSAGYIHSQGYFGVVGFDVLEDFEGNFYVIDGNIRLTGVTPLFMLRKKLEGEKLFSAQFSTEFEFDGILEKLFKRFKNEIHKRIFSVLSAVERGGKLKVYGVVAGEDSGKMMENKNGLAARGLIIT